MRVTLVHYTPNPELTVAMAAKLCYSSGSIDKTREGLTPERVASLLRAVREAGHLSTYEHAAFVFGIEGVSRALTHQLVRHRIGCSYSQQSQRYVKMAGFDYVTPPSVAANPEARAAFESAMREAGRAYEALLGMGVHQEDARYVLPNACETRLVASFNGRSLLHFFELRCCERAQWEIRQLAYAMLDLVRGVAPVMFEKAGPLCVTEGRCREGERSCGRLNTRRSGGSC